MALAIGVLQKTKIKIPKTPIIETIHRDVQYQGINTSHLDFSEDVNSCGLS